MICETIREGMECVFMSSKGCSYSKGVCFEILEECAGCGHVLALKAGSYCSSYPEPALKWKNGNCNFATHLKEEVKKGVKINPLKASKRYKK